MTGLCRAILRSCFAQHTSLSVRSASRAFFAAGLLVCFSVGNLWAASTANSIPGALEVHRSMRAVPHRLIVHPSEATVAADQTQQFQVTDAQGKPVSVHWNVSGIGCSGEGCGTINEYGVYKPPSKLPQPRMVTVEGVLVSDPNYSVLTEVKLEATATAAANTSHVVTLASKPQPLSPPAIEKQNVQRSSGTPAMPTAIAAAPTAAAPTIDRSSAAHKVDLPPVPSAVASAPVIEGRQMARKADVPKLPNAVPAPPSPAIEKSVIRTADLLPLPKVVPSAPAAVDSDITRKRERPPLPRVVAATPSVERATVSKGGTMPLPVVIGAAPEIDRAATTRKANLPPLPNAVASAPAVENSAARKRAVPPLPAAVAAAPPVEVAAASNKPALPQVPVATTAPPQAKVADNAPTIAAAKENVPPPAVSPAANTVLLGHQKDKVSGRQGNSGMVLELMASAAPAPVQMPRPKPQIIIDSPPPAAAGSAAVAVAATPANTLALAARRPAGGAVLTPMQDAVAATPTPATAMAAPGQNKSGVTYANGQLTINAENMSLATVLKLVAEKTGAVIDVPAGMGTEPIFEHTGPGRPEDVIATLLNGSPFDFVIVGSPQGSHDPTQVLLSLHQANATPMEAPARPAATASLWTPPPPPPVEAQPAVLVNDADMQLPKEQLTPEAMGDLMKARAQQLRERLNASQQ